MRVFLDTNILIDIVEERPRFFAASQAVLDRCDLLGCDISIAPHGLATVYYLTERTLGSAGAREVIQQILTWAEVAALGDVESRRALSYGIADYDDTLQAAAAE